MRPALARRSDPASSRAAEQRRRRWAHCRYRTISAAPHPRPLCSRALAGGRRQRRRAAHLGGERRVGFDVVLGENAECRQKERCALSDERDESPHRPPARGRLAGYGSADCVRARSLARHVDRARQDAAQSQLRQTASAHSGRIVLPLPSIRTCCHSGALPSAGSVHRWAYPGPLKEDRASSRSLTVLTVRESRSALAQVGLATPSCH